MVKTLAPWHAPKSQFGYVTAIDNYGNPITVCTTRTEADAGLQEVHGSGLVGAKVHAPSVVTPYLAR
jgi:hypothetical protein